jgi:hypothetical protein
MYRKVDVPPFATACQAGVLLLILLGILGLLAHSVAVGDQRGRVAGQPTLQGR